MDKLWECQICEADRPSTQLFLANKHNAKFLMGKAKHPASLSNLALGCFLPFLSIFVLVGLFMLGYGVVELKNAYDLKQDGVVTTGKMVANRYYENSEGDSHYLTYRFIANDQIYQKEQSVKEALYDDFEAGAPIQIRYIPSNPAKSRIEGTGNMGLFFLGFGGCWLSFTLFMVWGIISGAVKNHLLARKGYLINGHVVSAKCHKDSDDDYYIDLKYRYISPETAEVVHKRHRFIANERKKEPLPAQGTPLIILYRSEEHHQVL